MSASSDNEKSIVLDCQGVLKSLPHRYPFLLVDKILELEPGKRIVGVKAVTMNEPFFQGHFPGRPVMPGVLILESMAQTGAILARLTPGGAAPDGNLFLVGADSVKWKKQVLPGDTLRIEMTFLKRRRPLWILHGEVTVDGKLVASGDISACEVD